MKNSNKISTKTLALCSILTALVIILQFMGSFIKLGTFSISLVLIPIVIGAATCGIGAGAWLGFIFGLIVLLSGDAALFLGINAPGAIITVMLKGILCGTFAAVAYNLFKKKNRTLAVIVAAIVCPLVNTGIFLLGCRAFFFPAIMQWTEQLGFDNAVQYMIFGLVGANFLFELGVNIVVSPVIVRLLNIRKKQH